jgi:predicted nucleotidyltransferase
MRALPPLVQRAVERLIRAFGPERIVLYGSYAKGTQHDGSDVDLLIVARATGSGEQRLRRARQLAADSFPPLDVMLCTPAEVACAAAAPSPFLQSILESGRTIYQREANVQ